MRCRGRRRSCRDRRSQPCYLVPDRHRRTPRPSCRSVFHHPLTCKRILDQLCTSCSHWTGHRLCTGVPRNRATVAARAYKTGKVTPIELSSTVLQVAPPLTDLASGPTLQDAYANALGEQLRILGKKAALVKLTRNKRLLELFFKQFFLNDRLCD